MIAMLRMPFRTASPSMAVIWAVVIVLHQESQAKCPASSTISGKRLGAGNGTRTRDPLLGKQMLYQLSYSRTVEGPQGPAMNIHRRAVTRPAPVSGQHGPERARRGGRDGYALWSGGLQGQ